MNFYLHCKLRYQSTILSLLIHEHFINVSFLANISNYYFVIALSVFVAYQQAAGVNVMQIWVPLLFSIFNAPILNTVFNTDAD